MEPPSKIRRIGDGSQSGELLDEGQANGPEQAAAPPSIPDTASATAAGGAQVPKVVKGRAAASKNYDDRELTGPP